MLVVVSTNSSREKHLTVSFFIETPSHVWCIVGWFGLEKKSRGNYATPVGMLKCSHLRGQVPCMCISRHFHRHAEAIICQMYKPYLLCV